MSVYVVSNNHINVLVSWFITDSDIDKLWVRIGGQYTYLDRGNAPRVAYELHKQNVRCVNYHYNDNKSDEQYIFTEVENARQVYSLAEIAGAIDCLEYESNETDDYKQTEAYEIITSMRRKLLEEVQKRDLGDNVTWEIGKLKDTPVKLN
jgi:hypothetical protein